MKTIIENVIASGQYKLEDMLKKIDTFWVQGTLTDDERTSLIQMAQDRADPTKSYAPLQEQINGAFEKIDDLTTKVNANASSIKALQESVAQLGGSVSPGEPEPEPEEWPEFVQPSGAHDAYNIGDKVTYKGEKYICQMAGCVWAPDVYPAAWEKQ